MGQHESTLGQKLGFLDLQDAVAASPDVSAKTWQVNAGGTAAWIEQPQLKCTAWTPPPQTVKVPQHRHILELHCDRSFTCDVCRRSFSSGDHSYYCRNCDFDACIACASKFFPQPTTEKAQQDAEDAQLAAAIAASLAISGPVTPPPPPPTLATSLATTRFIESYSQPERRPDQLYARITTERH